MRFLMAVWAALIWLSTTCSAAPLYNKHVDGWLTGAYSDDRTGQFSHCGASVAYQSGVLLVFAVSRDFHWSMGLANPSWRLAPGTTYRIAYQIDQQAPTTADAVVIGPNQTETQLIDSQALFKAFQRGHLLTVQAAGQTFYFNLQGSGKALAESLNCAITNVASAGTGANPFVAPVTPTPQTTNAPSQAAFRAEAAALAANLLSSAGVQGFQIVSEIPPQLSAFHSVWTAPGLVGGVVISPDTDVDAGTAEITAHRAQDCKGKFGVVKLPVTAAGASIKTLCEISPDNATVETYLLLPRAAGGVFLFTIFEVNGGAVTAPDNAPSASAQTAGANAEATSARLMEASIRVLGR